MRSLMRTSGRILQVCAATIVCIFGFCLFGMSVNASTQSDIKDDVVLEPVEKIQHAQELEEKRISVNFQNIDVKSALSVLAELSGMNFVASETVQGELTLSLNDVTWQHALEVILTAKGLDKRVFSDVIWVAPLDEIQESEEKRLKLSAVKLDIEPLIIEHIPINFAKANEVAAVIKSVRLANNPQLNDLIKKERRYKELQTDRDSLLTERGSVTVDVRSNSVLVQDVESKVREVRALIKKLDQPVQQVLIETKIVEASDSFSKELGARLGFQRVTENAQLPGSSSNLGNFSGSGSIAAFSEFNNQALNQSPELVFDSVRSRPQALAVNLGANGIDGNTPASYAFELFRAGTGFAHLITLELSALEADGRGKIVASPRLLTANQKQAVIKQGEERVFTVIADDSVAVETKEAVLALEVTPQITPDDHVILDVRISQDTFIPNADINTAAALRKKEIVTQVLAENGETIVIGGIYQEESIKGEVKVPWLGDLPALGRLFRKKSSRQSKIELLIFLTPKIIKQN